MPPRKNQTFSRQRNIGIVTNYGKFKSPTALTREFRTHLASGDVSLSKLPGPSRTDLRADILFRFQDDHSSLIPGQII